MTTALIADDEPHLRRALARALAALWPELQVVHMAGNGLEAAEHIARLQPDLAFLDIRMPGLTGLEVAQGIEGSTRVVFVTAYDNFAVQAFEAEAIDYVLKPVNAERLARTLERVKRALGSGAPNDEQTGAETGEATGETTGAKSGTAEHTTFTGFSDGQLANLLQRLLPKPAAAATDASRLRWVRASHGDITHQVPVQDVLFFRADDKYTCVQTASAEHLIRTPIADLAAALDPAVFVQVHRSTIVNLEHLAGTRRDEVSRLFLRIKGHAQELPVSRAYVHLFKAM